MINGLLTNYYSHCKTLFFSEDRNSSEEDKSQNISSNKVCQSDLVDSALPAADNRQQRIAELRKLKANCKPEELAKLKTKCEMLVRDCIAGLLIQLSVKDFKEVEGKSCNLLIAVYVEIS